MSTNTLIFYLIKEKILLIKSKFQRFLFKRVLILLMILTIFDLIFVKKPIIVLVGIIIGTVFSFIRFSSMEAFFTRLLSIDKKGTAAKKSVINFIVSQAVTIALLVITMIINMGLFAGTVAGILTVPTIIFINAATEGFGLTHNNFE